MPDNTLTSRHVSTFVDAPPEAVYAVASDPSRLPEWASGLASTPLTQEGDEWVAHAPFGRVTVRFAPTNSFGVLDHVVTMPTGEQVLNPMRVVAWGDGSEVVFSVRQRDGMSDDELDSDAATVTTDLATLKGIVESG